MNDERPDASLFVGLHKLAAQNGDGLIPELYARLSERERYVSEPYRQERKNVVRFPYLRTRPPGEEPLNPLGPEVENGANILTFRERAS